MKQMNVRNRTMFLLLCFFSTVLFGQTNPGESYLRRENFENYLPELKSEFGNKKIIPKELELECLVALSYYPELENTAIEFKFGDLNFTMISKPKFMSFLKERDDREYVILIQRPGRSEKNVEWKELSFNAMVGWIGHELGHVVHYSHKSNGGIIFTGVKYAFPAYRRKMERFTDQLAIQHELGYALYEGVDYTINISHATEHYRNNQMKYYLHPEEILERIHSKQSWSAVFRKTKMKHCPDIASTAAPARF